MLVISISSSTNVKSKEDFLWVYNFNLERSLRASLNVCRLSDIICLEKLAEYRGHKRLSVVFQETFSNYIEYLYPNFCRIYKHASDAAYYTLCTFIYSDVELNK